MPIKWKMLKWRKTGKTSTHYRVTLQKTDGKWYRYTIHRLVYCTFNWLSLKDNKNWSYVLHKNDIARDNRLCNLYMGDQRDNFRDMFNNIAHKSKMLIV